MTRPALVSAVLAALTFGLGFTPVSAVEAAQSTPSAQTAAPHDEFEHQHSATEAEAGPHHMMQMHQQMMAEMKAADARLDALVRDMNAATGDARITAVAAVVNELARQHKAMSGRMGHMCEQMMGERGQKLHR